MDSVLGIARFSNPDHCRDQVIQWSDIAEHLGVETKIASRAKHCDSVVADWPGKDDTITRAGAGTPNGYSGSKNSNPGRIDIHAVRFPLLNHFGIASDDLNPGFRSNCL